VLDDPSKLYRQRQFEAGHGDQYGIDKRYRRRKAINEWRQHANRPPDHVIEGLSEINRDLPQHLRANKRDRRAHAPGFFPDVYVVSNPKGFGLPTADLLKLLMAVINQARADLDRGPHNISRQDRRSVDYMDAIAWFREIDPDCNRPFSLDWCCSYLQTLGESEWNAERIRVAVFERERGRQRKRRGGKRRATVVSITSRALPDFEEE
jgi:hypothetical protein